MLAGASLPHSAQLGNTPIAKDAAQRLGLTRSWFAQVELNRSRNHIVRCVLAGDQLVVLTSAGLLHSLDAQTGETLWSVQVGNADYENLGPAVNDNFVALLNGSTLYLLDRTSGRFVFSRQVGGGPGAAPALADHYVFVLLVNGRIEGYPLDNPKSRPWYYQSRGRTLVTPSATPETVVWSTSSGYLYVGNPGGANSRPTVRYRLETDSPFDVPPACRQPIIYAVTTAGELYAVNEQSGQPRWKFVTGYPARRSPAVVGPNVFVTSAKPALDCVDATTGALRWEAPGIAQFAAASPTRVYGMDPYGTLVALDAASGVPTGRVVIGAAVSVVANEQTDRLYLVSDSGLVQCLHEIGVTEPVRYQQAPPAAAPPDKGPQAVPPAYEEEAAPRVEPQAPRSVENPFAPAAPGGQGEVPFGGAPNAAPEPAGTQRPGAAQPPAATPAPEESPFGPEGDNPFDF